VSVSEVVFVQIEEGLSSKIFVNGNFVRTNRLFGRLFGAMLEDAVSIVTKRPHKSFKLSCK